MTSVTFSRGELKYSSNLSGSPIDSGWCQCSVASCIEVRSKTSTKRSLNYQLELTEHRLENSLLSLLWHTSDYLSYRVYTWLSSWENSDISQNKLLIPEWVLCKGASKGRVWIYCNGYSTYRCVVEYMFLNELVLSCRKDISLCQSFHVVVLNWSISYLRYSPFVTVFFEHHAPSVQRTVHNTLAKIGILVYHVEIWSRSN